MLLEKTVLVCYSCERSVGSFSWDWSESLTRRRSADALLKPGAISVSTYVQPRGLVILALFLWQGLVRPVPRPALSELPVVPVSQLCPLYETEAESAGLKTSSASSKHEPQPYFYLGYPTC